MKVSNIGELGQEGVSIVVKVEGHQHKQGDGVIYLGTPLFNMG